MLQNCLFHKIQKNFNAPINKQKSQVHYTCIHRTDFELAFLYCTMVRAAFCCCYNCFFNSRLYLIGQFAYTLCLSHCYLWHLLQEWLESVSYTHVVISDYRTLKKGSSAENLKSVCIRYNLPTLVWNAAKLYGCFAPEWDNPHSWINFSWFALTFLSPSTDMDLICVLPTLSFLPLQLSVSGFCMSAIWSTIPIPVFLLLILSTAVADCIVFLFSIEGRGVGGVVKPNILASFQYAWQQGICASASHTIFSIPVSLLATDVFSGLCFFLSQSPLLPLGHFYPVIFKSLTSSSTNINPI